jgi:iron complex transport system permease protein
MGSQHRYGKAVVHAIYEGIVNQFTSGMAIETAGQGPVHDIIWLLRLPRLVLAALVGMGLSVCGVIMQAVVKNPLADPYILGISSGASLGATAAILLGIGVALGENFVGIAAFTVPLLCRWVYCLSLIWADVAIPLSCFWVVWL